MIEIQLPSFYTILFIILAIPLISFLYLVFRYIIKPYRQISFYKKQKIIGTTIIPFVPVIGAFAFIQKDYKEHRDQFYTLKRSFQIQPHLRVYISNLFDKIWITIMDPQLIKEFFSKQTSDYYIKQPYFVDNRKRAIGNGIAFAQGQQWKLRRKIISQAFHYQFFHSFIPIMKNILKIALKQQKLDNIDAMRFSSKIAGKAVIKSFFGIDCNDKIKDCDITEWLNSLIMKIGDQQRTLRSFLFGVKFLNLGLFKQDKEVNEMIKLYRAWAKNQIQEKINEDDKKSQSITIIKFLKDKRLINAKDGLTVQQISQEFMTLFTGGADTTAHLICLTLYYLSLNQNKNIQIKLRQLLEKQKSFHDPTYMKDLNNSSETAKYLQAILNQTFRHYSYMTGLFPRVAMQDHYLKDIPIKKGVIVNTGWIQNNFNSQYFGQQVFKFRPQRWLQTQQVNQRQRQMEQEQPKKQKTKRQVKLQSSNYIFTPFSIGSRGCLGQTFALLETKIVISHLILNYEIVLGDGYIHKLKQRALYEPEDKIPLKFIQIKK